MQRTWLGLLSGVVLLWGGACGSQYAPETYGSGTGGDSGGTGGAGGSGGSNPLQGDLPCDVAQVLETSCNSCHGRPTAGGAPISLVTRADLMATSALGGAQVSRAVTRMKATTAPMPPAPAAAASAADIATLQAWVDAGMPSGACGSAGTGGTGGTPTPTPGVCLSGSTWKMGNEGSADMNPGLACISCHATNREAPKLTIAGTVFEALNEPDLCNSPSAAGAQIIITGADGVALPAITATSSGNFSYRGTVKTPFTAKVVYKGKERAMATPQTSGDCNACHTATGASGTSGRIFLP